MNSIQIGEQIFSAVNNLVIAEVAQAHDGSLGTAHAYIDAIARAGVSAVKFQTHIASAESTPAEPWRVRFSKQDATRFDYWKRMEFTPEQWAGLKQHAEERGLHFLSSPFSMEAFELLSQIGVAAWKVASGEVTNKHLFDRMLASRLPILLSTGMSPVSEIDGLVERIRQAGNSLAVLQCTSMYPTPPEKVGLNLIPYFRARYDCPAGLSDHSGSIYAGLAATTLGASVLEVHVAFSREVFGPDVAASITTSELKQLVEGVQFIQSAMANPVDKSQMAEELDSMRGMFTKSIVARRDLPAGSVLQEDMLAFKKPGSGLPPDRLAAVVGRRLRVRLLKDSLLSEDDLE
jgi:N,N'-diacetyllegionaminate synthase